MHHLSKRSVEAALLILVVFLASSCTKDICNVEVTYTRATPILDDLAKFRVPIASDYNATIEAPGKIFVDDDYLYISEEDKGIHIIDNQDPTNPTPINFIAIPGNKDLVIKDKVLIADNYYDLIMVDVSNPLQPVLLSRTEEAFPVTISTTDDLDLIGFKFEVVTEERTCAEASWQGQTIFFDEQNHLIPASQVPSSFAGATRSGRPSAGTLSRMAVNEDHLYIVNNRELLVFELQARDILPQSVQYVGDFIETVYPTEDRLFIGAQNGMHIYQLRDGGDPTREAMYDHAMSCDPVLPSGDVVYITLRNNGPCPGDNNQLDVVSLQSRTPTLIQSIQLESPHGMAMADQTLIVCEGDHGIKFFDTSSGRQLSLVGGNREVSAYDAIVDPKNPNVLLLIGSDGLSQYQLHDTDQLDLLSALTF